MKKLNCIMLIDDSKIDNFFHERIIRKYSADIKVVIKESGQEALNHLTGGDKILQPQIIFLDINMPGMNGWEFIEHYKNLDKELQKSMVVIMLSTSENPDDWTKAATIDILADYKSKPLTTEMLEEVIKNYYANSLL